MAALCRREISQIIYDLRGKFILTDILKALRFPKATYMYWQKRFHRPDADKALEDRILAVHRQNPDYGYRRVTIALRDQGVLINKKHVQRLMRKLHIQAEGCAKRAIHLDSTTYHSYQGKVGIVCKNRLRRRFCTAICHQKVTTDTTELKYVVKLPNGQFQVKGVYLDAFLDMYNREIISYRISSQPSEGAILAALNDAVKVTADCPVRRTFHSDQGWVYQMAAYHQRLKQERIFQSMSRKGTCLDNAIMENFFSILKREMYYGRVYHSFARLKLAIQRYIHYYNYVRIKERLGWLSPVAYRQRHSGDVVLDEGKQD